MSADVSDGATAVTADLMGRLERHYIAPTDDWAGGLFVPEVGKNGAWGTSQRCDAIYVGFTSASGRLLVGHEVKATRADWLVELKKIGKADTWADQCHEWWLVTVPGVVKAGELPAGWGLLHPGSRGRRMQVVAPAERRDVTPSWDAVRSVFARADTLHGREMLAFREKTRAEERGKVQAWVDGEVERRVAESRRGAADATVLQEKVRAYEAALGGALAPDGHDTSGWGGQYSAQELADLGALLRTHRGLAGATERLVSRYGPLERLGAEFARFREEVEAATASAGVPS